MTTRSIYVHLPYGWDPDAWADRYARGTAADASPYGFHLARDLGYRVCFSKDLPGSRFSLVQYVLMRLCFSIDVVHAFRNRQRIRDADAVWTILDSEGLAVALLMRLGIVERKPLIGNMVWMFDKWKRFGPPRRALLRKLAKVFAALTVHSNGCLPMAMKALPDVPVQLMYFGVNTDAYVLTAPVVGDAVGPIRILGIGNDPSRDWKTFLDAFAGDPRFAIKLVCKHIQQREVAHYANLELIRRPTMPAFRKLYEETDFAIVPMHANIFSGITVALEAVAFGKAVIATRTGGVPTYFAEEEMLFVPVGDAAAMRDAALATTPTMRHDIAARAQRRFMEHDYSTRGMMARYAALTRLADDSRAASPTIAPRGLAGNPTTE